MKPSYAASIACARVAWPGWFSMRMSLLSSAIHDLLFDMESRFKCFDFCFSFLQVHFLGLLSRLIVNHDQISTLYIESTQMVTCIFGIENVFVNDIGGAFGFFGRAPSKPMR